MPSQEFNPANFINRVAERELFQELLQLKHDARLLAIEDKEGTGKSTLLTMLKYQTLYTYVKPVSFVSLEEPTINSPFVFIERLRKGFGTRVKFENFDALNQARVNKVSARLAFSPTTISGSLDARDSVLTGSGIEMAGTMVKTTGTVVVNPNPIWSAEQEDYAREECIKGFIKDLKSIGGEPAVVALLDSYEQCNLELKDWIVNEFLWPMCFSDEPRPTRLILVLAGRDLPKFEKMLSQPKYEQFVRSKELSRWEEEHVKDFLKVHGYDDLTTLDIGYVWANVQQGFSIAEALRTANYLRLIRTKVS